MAWLLRPITLLIGSLILVIIAAGLLFWPPASAGNASRAALRPLPPGDREIVWLNPATSAVAWERFVAAVHRLAKDRPDLGLTIVPGPDPFPSETMSVPELAVERAGRSGRLWFRWYKLTADLGPEQWVAACGERPPAPLAIIGGSSSDRARDLAQALRAAQTRFAGAPLLFITTATADMVDGDRSLMTIYAGRTFRFCFTDRQMAEAVAQFIWAQEDLRPDAAPIYMTRWSDDPYSIDLFNQFHEVLSPEALGKRLENLRSVRAWVQRWVALGGRAVASPALALDLSGLYAEDLERFNPFWSTRFPYSIGAYSQPNRQEVEGADDLVDELAQHPQQRRPLLVLPATAQPARRFLRALIRTAPYEAERLVIATGDAIDFNTVYRDRNLTWPIQDFPIPLVFFCHRNPVDAESFTPHEGTASPDARGKTSTGTQDLLLYRDIAETVVEAGYTDAGPAADATALSLALRQPAESHRHRSFGPSGDQEGGSGEYVVTLRPVREGDRVLPRARLQVWTREATDPRRWMPVWVDGKSELLVPYTAGWITPPESGG